MPDRLKLFERFADPHFHTCLTTTFGIDFGAYETLALARLNGAGCSNNILVADDRMLTLALDDATALPARAGSSYSVKGVRVPGAFHPKMTLQLGRTKGQLIVASANMTTAGLAGNLEVAGVVVGAETAPGEQQVIAAAWRFARGIVGTPDAALRHQLDWLVPRTPWLAATVPAEGPVTFTDGTLAALLADNGGADAGIATRFVDLVGDDVPVRRLVVVSPYWDADLAALRSLVARLRPDNITLVVDPEAGLFPVHALERVPGATLHAPKPLADKRFVHAKVILVETDSADHVLFGSANCTVAALGPVGGRSRNCEVCLYRRLPAGAAAESLALDRLGPPLAADDVNPYRGGDAIALDEAEGRAAGQFEYAGAILSWHPPEEADLASVPELLDRSLAPLLATLRPCPATDGTRRFHVEGVAEPPAFARYRRPDDSPSAPAIVALVDAMRETVRDPRSPAARDAALRLTTELEEGLWLLDALGALEAGADPATARRRIAPKPATEDVANVRTFQSYEEFVAGRRHRDDDRASARSALSGTDASLVRDFLNRLLAVGDASLAERPDDPDAPDLDLTDETADGAASLEAGAEFSAAPGTVLPPPTHVVPPADRKLIAGAVETFSKRLREKAAGKGLDAVDVLRLRAMLTIVAAAGQPAHPGDALSNLQVLHISVGEEAWPKLLGRALYAFFGYRGPLGLKLDHDHAGLPVDILEGWVTSMWAVEAGQAAALGDSALRRDWPRRFEDLSLRIYAVIALQPTELHDPRILALFAGLSARFCGRLGLSAASLATSHAARIARITAALR